MWESRPSKGDKKRNDKRRQIEIKLEQLELDRQLKNISTIM